MFSFHLLCLISWALELPLDRLLREEELLDLDLRHQLFRGAMGTKVYQVLPKKLSIPPVEGRFCRIFP